MKKLSLLIIPSSYPKDNNDLNGIYIIDYIKSVREHCEITILDIQCNSNEKIVAETIKFEFRTFVFGLPSYNFKLKKYYNYFYFLISVHKIYTQITKYKFDLIHVHGSTFHGFIANRLSKRLKIPYVISEHTGPFTKISNNPILKLFSKYSIKNAKFFLPVSYDLLDQVKSAGINTSKVSITYNPIDSSVFHYSEVLPRKQFIFVGRLEEYKGAFRVVKAFHQICRSNKHWSLVIIGDGPEFSKIYLYLKQNNLEQKIQLLGRLSKHEIAEKLKQSSIFVFPSAHETCGITILEAMSCGLPIICGNLTAPKEFVHKQHGTLINPMKIDEISNAMESMISQLLFFDRKYISEYAKQNFSSEYFGKKLLSIYQEAV